MRLASVILRTWLPSPHRSVLSSPGGGGEERRHRMESLTHGLPLLRSAPLTCEGSFLWVRIRRREGGPECKILRLKLGSNVETSTVQHELPPPWQTELCLDTQTHLHTEMGAVHR